MMVRKLQPSLDELYERVLALEEGGGGGDGAVKGVKGAVETTYRKGNVSLALPNITNLGGGLTYNADDMTLVGTQVTSMPTASAENLGKILQYAGEETSDFKPGRFYTCEEATPGTYSWEETQVGETTPDSLTPEQIDSLISLLS